VEPRVVKRALETLAAGPRGRRRARELARRHRARWQTHGAWFTAEEKSTVAALAAVIVPANGEDPGAIEAGVPAALDRLVASSRARQGLYARGLLAVDEVARRRYGRGFAELSLDLQTDLLRHIERAYRRRRPRGPVAIDAARRLLLCLSHGWSGLLWATELFPQLVRDVKAAFYTSPVAWEALGYVGPPFPAVEVRGEQSAAVSDLVGVSSHGR